MNQNIFAIEVIYDQLDYLTQEDLELIQSYIQTLLVKKFGKEKKQ